MQKHILLIFMITLLITSCSTTGESVKNPVYAAEEETTLADFSGISDDALDYQLRISDVLHKAVIDVDEKGTEAAVVNVVEMETTSAEPTEPIRFNVDRPFVFFIVDQKTDVLLFVGVVRNIE